MMTPKNASMLEEKLNDDVQKLYLEHFSKMREFRYSDIHYSEIQDKFSRLKEITGVEIDYSREDIKKAIQKWHLHYFYDGNIGNSKKLEILTGVGPNVEDSRIRNNVQQRYWYHKQNGNFEGIEELKEYTGIEPNKNIIGDSND